MSAEAGLGGTQPNRARTPVLRSSLRVGSAFCAAEDKRFGSSI
jgi:hypothetical protein